VAGSTLSRESDRVRTGGSREVDDSALAARFVARLREQLPELDLLEAQQLAGQLDGTVRLTDQFVESLRYRRAQEFPGLDVLGDLLIVCEGFPFLDAYGASGKFRRQAVVATLSGLALEPGWEELRRRIATWTSMDDALSDADRAIAIADGIDGTWRGRCAAIWTENRWVTVRDMFATAPDEQPNVDSIFGTLIIVFQRSDRFAVDLARTYGMRGTYYAGRGERLPALKDYEEAARRFRELGRSADEAHCTSHAGEMYLDEGRYESAELALTDAATLYDELAMLRPLAKTVMNMATAQQNRGHHKQARNNFETAVEKFSALDMPHDAAVARLGLGRLLQRTEDDQTVAEPVLLEARAALNEAGDTRNSAECSMILGAIYANTYRTHDAVVALRSAWEVFEHHREPRNVAMCARALGQTYVFVDRYHEAERVLLVAYERFDALGMMDETTDTLRQLGAVYSDTGRFAEAELVLGEAEERLLAHGSVTESVRCRVDRGQVQLMEGRYEEAEQTVRSAREKFVDTAGDRGYLNHCDQFLADIYMSTGRFDEAEHLFDKLRLSPGRKANQRQNVRYGILLAHRGRPKEAEKIFEDARNRYMEQGRAANVAACDFHIGFTRSMYGRSLDNDERLLRAAMDRLVPSIFFGTSQRFQFVDQHIRGAWAKRAAPQVQAAFETASALGDEVMMTDLVETMINAGVHSTGESIDPLSLTNIVDSAQSDAGHALAERVSLLCTGASRLAAGAVLPMSPPPRLLMSPSREALAPHLDHADSWYGVVPQPRDKIPTW